MKRQKKLLSSLLLMSLFLTLLPSFPIKAAAADYDISQYDIELKVRENATVEVIERLDVHFNKPCSQLVRSIPLKHSRKLKNANGRRMVYKYRTPVYHVSVLGAPYTEKKKGSYLNIIIGGEDNTFTGDKQYEISYVYDMGEDRIKDYDRFYYPILSSEWNTSIKKINFTIDFDKKADLSGLKLYNEQTDDGKASDIVFKVEGTHVTGAGENLTPGETITADLLLPEGYYQGVRKFNPLPSILLLLIVCVFLIRGILLYYRHCKKKAQSPLIGQQPEAPPEAKRKELKDRSVSRKHILNFVAAAIFTGSALFFCGGTLDNRMRILSILMGVVLLAGGLFLNRCWNNPLHKKTVLILRYVAVAVAYGVPAGLFLWWNNYVHPLLLFLIIAAGLAAVLFAAPIQDHTTGS